MNRRQHIRALAGVMGAAASLAGQQGAGAIQLHVDLEVDPAREKELVANFRNIFRPAIRKQPGFVDVKLLKLRSELAGKAPRNFTYRLLIGFRTEEQRQRWVNTDEHQKAWPTLERTLKGAKTIVLLYDTV
jgi:heme-degrading monooxygenase HmoA